MASLVVAGPDEDDVVAGGGAAPNAVAEALCVSRRSADACTELPYAEIDSHVCETMLMTLSLEHPYGADSESPLGAGQFGTSLRLRFAASAHTNAAEHPYADVGTSLRDSAFPLELPYEANRSFQIDSQIACVGIFQIAPSPLL